MSVVVDARGLACPLPVIRLAASARDLPDGALVTVLWTDPAAEHDIPAWARMRGHHVVSTDVSTDAGGVHADDDVAADVTEPEDGTTHGRTTVRLGSRDAPVPRTHDGPVPTGTGPS